jgi:hypothetical protein
MTWLGGKLSFPIWEVFGRQLPRGCPRLVPSADRQMRIGGFPPNDGGTQAVIE